MAQKRRYKKIGMNPDNYVFVYFGAPGPNHWYVRLGGLDAPMFRHGLSLAGSFPTEELTEEYKKEVVEYMGKAFKIKWRKLSIWIK